MKLIICLASLCEVYEEVTYQMRNVLFQCVSCFEFLQIKAAIRMKPQELKRYFIGNIIGKIKGYLNFNGKIFMSFTAQGHKGSAHKSHDLFFLM